MSGRRMRRISVYSPGRTDQGRAAWEKITGEAVPRAKAELEGKGDGWDTAGRIDEGL